MGRVGAGGEFGGRMLVLERRHGGSRGGCLEESGAGGLLCFVCEVDALGAEGGRFCEFVQAAMECSVLSEGPNSLVP